MKKSEDISFYFKDRNYDYPLCGFSDYKDQLNAGDIIGVIIKDNNLTEENYPNVFFNIVKKEKLKDLVNLYPKKFQYNRIEEHMFKISEISQEGLLSIVPVFIEENKVITKNLFVYENVNLFISKDFLDEDLYLNDKKFFSNAGFDYLMFEKVKKFLAKFEKYKKLDNNLKYQYKFFCEKTEYEKLSDKERNKAICIPYENYKSLFFNIYNQYFKIFFSFLDENLELLKELFGKDIFNYLGTTKEIIENCENILKTILDKEVYYEGYYYCTKIQNLENSKFDLTINKINIKNVFRVYKSDPNYISKKTKERQLIDWTGIRLSNENLKKLKVNNIIRLVISEKDNKCCFNAYFQIIKKINDHLFFVCLYDQYTNIYELEDVLIVINSDLINELPLDYEENSNLSNGLIYYQIESNQDITDKFFELDYNFLFEEY